MYLDSKDFQTVWRLAHNWVGADPDKSDPNALSTELKEAIHRLMSAAISRAITIRTRRMKFFMDETFLSIIFEFHHYKKFWKCLNGDEFNKAYLDSIYVKRGDVLRWCQNEFHEPPPVWRLADLKNNINRNLQPRPMQSIVPKMKKLIVNFARPLQPHYGLLTLTYTRHTWLDPKSSSNMGKEGFTRI